MFSGDALRVRIKVGRVNDRLRLTWPLVLDDLWKWDVERSCSTCIKPFSVVVD